MALIVVERELSGQPDLASVQSKEDAVAWCLEQYGVRFLCTYFARDASRMICLYEAPDAESVRQTQRTAGLPVAAAWPAESLFGLDETGERHQAGDKTVVVVRRVFPRASTMPELHALQSGAGWCLEMHDASMVDSYVHANLQESVCVFVAPDAEAIRKASRMGGLPLEQAWPASYHRAGQR